MAAREKGGVDDGTVLVVEVERLRFHLGQWGVSLHLAADRIDAQFAYRPQRVHAWLG